MTTATATSHLQLIPPVSAGEGPQSATATTAQYLNHLVSAAAHLAHIDPTALGTADSVAIARAVESVARAAEATLIRCVHMWNDRGDPIQTPATTDEERSWRIADAARRALIVDLGRSRREAGRLIATAKALRRDPLTEEVLRQGGLSVPQARIIAETVSSTAAHNPPEVVVSTRRTLIARAQAEGTDGLRRCSADVAHRNSPDAVLNRARTAEAKRAFFLRPVADGYVPGGFIPTTGAETLLAVLDALASTPSPGEENGQARVRADALVRLGEDRLRTGELPRRRNGPTAMTIVMRADTALGLPGAPPAVTGYGQALPAAEAHMLVCESALRSVLVNGDGEILWQGRSRRLATRAQYEALAVRDGGCTAPACDRPAHECDAHHLIPWAEGGHTDVDQMRLLCRRHHRETHDELWQRQYGWQEAEIRTRNEERKFAQPRRPWYTDTPAWYPGPSPWHPEGNTVQEVTVARGEEAPNPADSYPAAA
jgi:hypothetical protein